MYIFFLEEGSDTAGRRCAAVRRARRAAFDQIFAFGLFKLYRQVLAPQSKSDERESTATHNQQQETIGYGLQKPDGSYATARSPATGISCILYTEGRYRQTV